MTYSKTPFDQVKLEVEKIFLPSEFTNWSFLPEDIYSLAVSAGIQPQQKKIDAWGLFENGRIDFSDDMFFNSLFEKIKLLENTVIIITDECFIDSSAYALAGKYLTEFASTTYPEIHQADFFQPSDMIFIFPDDQRLIILHHEGYVLEFKGKG